MSRRPTDYVNDRGQPASWDAIRLHVLRQHPVCVLCGVAPSVEVDHIWPRHFGGDDQSTNLQAVCVACNRAKGNSVDPAAATLTELEAGITAALRRCHQSLAEVDRLVYEIAARGNDAHRLCVWEGMNALTDQVKWFQAIARLEAA